MFRNHILAAVAAMGLLAGAPGAQAAPEQPTAVTPNAHKLELAKRVFAGMHTDKLMHDAIAPMMPRMLEQMRRNNPNISDAEAKAASDAVSETMDEMMSEMVEKMIPVYADTFTEKELEDMVAFYEGPSGRAMLAKMPTVMAKLSPMMGEMAPKIADRLKARVCSKIDCNAAPGAGKN